MNLATARGAVAGAASTVAGYNVRPRPFPGAPRPGDGWVVLTRLQPSDFTRSMASLTVVLVLGSDEVMAETRLDTDAVELLAAITLDSELYPTDVSLEPISIVTGTAPAPLFGASITLNLEVD